MYLSFRDAMPSELDDGKVAFTNGALDVVEADADGLRVAVTIAIPHRRDLRNPRPLGAHYALRWCAHLLLDNSMCIVMLVAARVGVAFGECV